MANTTCGVCGTVNVVASGRCMACGQPLPGAPGVVDDSPTATTGPGGEEHTAGANAPQPEARTDPVPAVRASAAHRPTAPAPPPAPAAPALPAGRASAAGDEIRAAAARRTVVEASRPEPVPAPAADAPPAPRPASKTRPAHEPEPAAAAGDAAFTVRLLLPEGDKRNVDVGSAPVPVGSGLDEVGLSGDPRVRPSEATLAVVGGRLWIEAAPDSTGVYVRIDGEVSLAEGDVVLVGDIAAAFHAGVHHVPASPDAQVLGGAAATPCGRLVFLRRDGSPGPVHDLPQGKTILGRTDGHLNFPNDSRLSRRHARFHATDEGVTLEDLDSRNGTYLRVRGRRKLEVGDALRIGSAGLQIRARG